MYLSVLALEEIAAGDGAISTIVSVQNSLPCGITQRYGTEAQKQKYLTKLATGEWLGCFCLTEPQVGSDASAIECKAEKDGEDWVLNGTKQFITTGKYADVALVFAVTDKTAGKKGIPAFLVPTNTPGYIVGTFRRQNGTALFRYRHHRVGKLPFPAENLLGKKVKATKLHSLI